MTKEISELTETEAKAMINSISKTMYKEYDISENSIQNFWNMIKMGIQTLSEKHAQQIDKLKSNPDIAYV